MTVQRFYRVHRFLGQLLPQAPRHSSRPSRDGNVDFSLAASLPMDFPSVAASPSISRISSSIWNARPSFHRKRVPERGCPRRSHRRPQPSSHAAREQTSGLELLQQAQLIERDFAMLGTHIEHLTADHAVHARVFAQNANTAHDGLRRNILCCRSRLKAAVSSPSPARTAVASSKALWQVGLPRRKSSLSMHGRSSWMSE